MRPKLPWVLCSAWAMAASACGDEFEFTKRPEPAGTRAWITSIQDQTGTLVRLEASEIAGRIILDPPPTDRVLQIEILAFEDPLETLGLDPGPLEASEGCNRTCSLLEPLGNFIATVDERGEITPWEESPSTPVTREALVRDHAVRCNQCVPYDKRFVRFEGEFVDFTTAFMKDGPDWTYVGLERGDLFRMNEDLQPAPVCSAFTNLRLREAVLHEDALWIVDSFGLHRLRLSAQEPGLPCVVDASFPAPLPQPDFKTVVGNADPASFELFALGGLGALMRFDGQTWTLVHTFVLGSDEHFTALYLGPGRVSVSVGGDTLHFVDNGVVSSSRIPRANAFIRGQAMDAEFGLAVLLREGGLAFLQDGEWSFASDAPDAWINARAVAIEDGGLLYTIATGIFGRWYPGPRGFCPIQDGLSGELVTKLGRVGRHLLFDDVTNGARAGAAVGAVSKPRSICETPPQ